MATVGIVLAIIVGVVLISTILIALVVGVRSLPDLQRYLRVKKM